MSSQAERTGIKALAKSMSTKDLQWQIANCRKLKIPSDLKRLFEEELASRFNVGDRVINMHNNEEGRVLLIPRERELADCVVVQFGGRGDGLTMLKTQLRKV